MQDAYVFRHATLALLLVCTSACVSVTRSPRLPVAAPAAASAENAVVDRLLLGRSIPGGGEVTDEEWRRFLAEVVTPRFPDGLTVLRGEGQWRGADGAVVRENSIVLEIVHAGGPAADASIRAIAEAYRKRFRQDAVLHTRHRAVMHVLE